MSNIKNAEYFGASYWDWTPFNECFLSPSGEQTGIRISDIDGHAERYGHFLWIETTRRNGEITIGQLRSVKHRVCRGDMAIIVFGKPNQPNGIHIYRPHSVNPVKRQPCNIQQIKTIVRSWFLWANANGTLEPFQNLLVPNMEENEIPF